jgi:mycoredoxin
MIKVYGADWCGDTKRTLKYLHSLNVNYDYVDVEQDVSAILLPAKTKRLD